VPVWPARVAVVLGSALVVVSYALQAIHAAHSVATGRPDTAAPAASTHL
jgi:hypothetical protein